MLDFFKEIFASFKQNSVERIRNPYVGAFVFSWFGFNWQTLSIMLFSKKDVIERVEYVKQHYDVGDFILAPALTTIVICILLPWANKIFTKIQSKPLSDTTAMLMQSKIDIAEKQLQIADMEAKKKLAQKREERNIEENISAICRELEETKIKNKEISEKLTTCEGKLKDQSIIRADTEIELRATAEQLDKTLKDYKRLLEKNEITSLQIKNQENAIDKLEDEIQIFRQDNIDLASEYKTIFVITQDYRLKIVESAITPLKDLDDIPY